MGNTASYLRLQRSAFSSPFRRQRSDASGTLFTTVAIGLSINPLGRSHHVFKNHRMNILGLSTLAAVLTFLAIGAAQAADKRCLAVHVPQDDPKALKQAVNIAANIPKQLGIDNVTVEVVAQGPGLKLLTEGSPEGERIRSLITESESTMGGGTKFSACAATIAGIKKRTGKEPVLLEGVGVVHPGAVARVMELQEQGCSYIRI
jgi:intracellular sulfur oxidation DsrE/DsrF family protein